VTPIFPALGFCKLDDPDAPVGSERMAYIYDDADFSYSAMWRLEYWPRLGMVIVGSDLRTWKVVRVVDCGVVGSIGERILRFLVRQSTHRFEHEFEEMEPISLDQLKSRTAASILADRNHWRDDEAIAGEDGPPRDEQEMLDELIAGVHSAQSLDDIIDVLYG